jgi:hypothetical protein
MPYVFRIVFLYFTLLTVSKKPIVCHLVSLPSMSGPCSAILHDDQMADFEGTTLLDNKHYYEHTLRPGRRSIFASTNNNISCCC